MDKINRILILYSLLMRGNEINKTIFCFENECSFRSFDRDIEDIRLFLSDSFSMQELEYNRKSNTYYLKGQKIQSLDVTEYLFIECLLKYSNLIREDELDMLLSHLRMNTNDINKRISNDSHLLSDKATQKNNRTSLKMFGDLELAIRKRKVISVVYQEKNNAKEKYEILPFCIRYYKGMLYFTGLIKGNDLFTDIQLDRVISFEIIRDMTDDEVRKIEKTAEAFNFA